jgi:capsular exopolysaccharide synthesis family protein
MNAKEESEIEHHSLEKAGTYALSQQHQAEQGSSEIVVNEESSKTSLRDICYISFRHKWKMILFFFAVILIVTAVTSICAKVYRSEAKLLMRLGRESVTLDPTAATGQIIPLNLTQPRGNEINSELEILKNQELIEGVVDSIGAQKLLNHTDEKLTVKDADSRVLGRAKIALRTAVSRLKSPLKLFGLIESLSDRDKAIVNIKKHLKIENLKDSSIISISYDAENPKTAQEIVSKLIDLYLEKHIEAYRTPGSPQFFTEQTDHLQNKLTQSESELMDFKNKTGISSVREQQRLVAKRISTLKQEINQTEAALASSVARTLVDKEALLTEQVTISSLRAKINTQRKQLADAQKELKTLNYAEAKISHLTREASIQEANYRKYSENLEQARINYAMENERISNISVVQAATLPIKAIRPNKSVNLTLGFLLGIVGAIVLAIFSERLDHSLKTPDEVEERLQLPALASIPLVRSSKVFPAAKLKRQAKTQSKAAEKVPARLDIPAEISECYESLRERLLLQPNGPTKAPYVLAVIGCQRHEGVSAVTANLAAIISRHHENGHVLLVDANLKHPSVHKVFNIKLSPGLTDVLANGQNSRDVIQYLPAGNVHILSAGTLNGNFSEALDSDKFMELLNSIKEHYHFVVIDIPALNEASSAARLASLCDGTVLVVGAERLRREIMQRAKVQLVESNANILGVVLNRRRFHIPGWLYQRL